MYISNVINLGISINFYKKIQQTPNTKHRVTVECIFYAVFTQTHIYFIASKKYMCILYMCEEGVMVKYDFFFNL